MLEKLICRKDNSKWCEGSLKVKIEITAVLGLVPTINVGIQLYEVESKI
jgi:hypothetical protein